MPSPIDQLVACSRFVTIAEDEGGITVEANLWLDERKDAYTVNLRGWGKTVNRGAEVVLIKLASLATEPLSEEGERV